MPLRNSNSKYSPTSKEIVAALQVGVAISYISTIERATQDIVKAALAILIILGVVTFCVPFLGFWGNFKENVRLLNIYGRIVLPIAILEIATLVCLIIKEANDERLKSYKSMMYIICPLLSLCFVASFALATSIKKQAARG